MQKFHLCYGVALLLAVFTTGCSQNNGASQTSTPGQTSQTMTLLPAQTSESSALICLQSQFLTLNDSGNPPTLYQVDRYGVLQREIHTNANNVDWEAMTLHQGTLLVADIGNNSGNRSSITLYQFDWPLVHSSAGSAPIERSAAMQSNTAKQSKVQYRQAYQFSYPAQLLPAAQPVQPYQHDLDAEALVSTGEQLLLLSKNWLSDGSQVYALDLQQQSMQKIADIQGLPGLVTDAAFDSNTQQFILTGYQNLRRHALSFALTGDYQPFVALADKDFRVLKVHMLPGAGQVEGVCLDAQQEIWLSQERSRQLPALLWRFGPLQQLQAQ